MAEYESAPTENRVKIVVKMTSFLSNDFAKMMKYDVDIGKVSDERTEEYS